MAASPTKRKRNKRKQPDLKSAVVDAVLTEAVKFIHQWTHRELSRLNQDKQILILPGGARDEYLIGRYRLHKQNDHCWTVINESNTLIQHFYDRRAALFYCLGAQGAYTSRAEEIRRLDSMLGKLCLDWGWYIRSLKTAKKEKNWHLYDTVEARISDISTKVEYVQEQLEKSLRWAKYKKHQDGSK